MEYLFFGLMGIAMAIGSLVGFFSLFTKGDEQTKLKKLERDIELLKSRLSKIELTKNEETQILESVRVAKEDAQPAVSVPIAPTALSTALAMPENQNVSVEDDYSTVETPADITEATQIRPQKVSPIEPSAPNFIERGIDYAKSWLLGGNTLVRSGVVILLIGVSFLIKYVAEHSQIPIELRLTAIAMSGVALLIVGWRLRYKRAEYAWAIQGGGVGILYLTIFAAMKLYQLIPPEIAFVLLIAVAFLSALIAILQNAMPLAILGFTGGFLAPIFASTGAGSHVNLFSYYLVLNLAIAYIAYYKSWRPLNVLGFGFTFIVATMWGANSYQPQYFASTEPFLIIHFLLFTLIAVLYAYRQATKARDYVDATLVFGTPLVGFSLQYALLRDSHFALAYSALVLALFYIGLAWWILNRRRETLQFLGECFLALGIGFGTLALPLALDGRWTSAAWAVEGVGLLWVGLRQNRLFPLIAGLALQLLGALAFIQGWGLTGHVETAHENMFLGVAFIALASWACGALLNQYRNGQWHLLNRVLAIWGWLWWMGAGFIAIDDRLPSNVFIHASLAFAALSSVLLPVAAKKLQWSRLSGLSVLLLPLMALVAVIEVFESHPFAHAGAYSWLISIAAYVFLLMQQHLPKGAIPRAPLLWIVAVIGAMEWQYQLVQLVGRDGVWYQIGWAVVPMLLVAAMCYWQFHRKDPLSINALACARVWVWTACIPLVAFVIVWFMGMSLNSDGNAAPLPYIPLLNPLDIALAGGLLLLLIWHRLIAQHFQKRVKVIPMVAGLMAFTLLNGVLLRTLHHWVGTPFQWVAIFDYPVVQMAFTLLWTTTAFILMLLAHKQAKRHVWIIGAGLMGLVVAKIFLLDLAQHGTVERIVSFIGVGLMLLVMGYFAPLPPTQIEEAQTEKETA
ncbi:MAG TPA: DUF2339 domain-containing protein [Methylophilaceae bacterium]|nr:DUF2339 domain-containing protein [Methylophilaceae bacterium]